MKNQSFASASGQASLAEKVRVPRQTKPSTLLSVVLFAMMVPCVLFLSRDGNAYQLSNISLFDFYFYKKNDFGSAHFSKKVIAENVSIQKGNAALLEKQFPVAIQEYESALANGALEERHKDLLLYQLGIAQLGAGNTNEASRLFYQLMDNGNPEVYEGARWYLALIKLKTNDLPSARQLLGVLGNGPGHQYSKEAKLLLRDLARVKP